MEEQFWKFINGNGDFVFPEPDKVSRLYFPLANETEFMSSITPLLGGDIKVSQNHFLTLPLSSEDLYSQTTNRNFWIYIDKKTVWSATGIPCLDKGSEKVTLKAGILWHTLKRQNRKCGLEAEITNFIPISNEHVELMMIKLTNITAKTITLTPTSAIPIFGRSADNLRDHRHVTSLLHRIKLLPQGIVVKPVMSFDERGHKINHFSYFVLGCEQNGELPIGFFPTIAEFIGEGGCLISPRAILENLSPIKKIKNTHQGKEAMGALRFKEKTLIPDESITYILMLGIAENPKAINQIYKKFNHKEKIECALSENIDYWKNKIDSIGFSTADQTLDNWLRWVTLQPILRKIFGCSFLPDFDYGRGGKGWRDLWQDCLALIFTHPVQIREILSANFAGVRIGGSNATIITKKPGYFIADRNKITRVWMDHGVWPYFTLQLYIHQTGDFNVLFENRTYFYDHQLSRAKEIDYNWNPRFKHFKHLHTKEGRIYKGTILEHILVQHLVQFFNVGKHNNIRLEDADWNDGLDMASEKGESVTFTCFYAGNLYDLTMLLKEVKKRYQKKKIVLNKELLILLDHLRKKPIDYNNPNKKIEVLNRYFKAVKFRVSGEKAEVNIDALINDLFRKWRWMFEHVRKKEWVAIDKKTGFFNGYYDNKSRRVEGRVNGKIRMTLTGQVFPVMSGISTNLQTTQIFNAVNKFLKDKKLGGFRLNTDFKTPQFDLGRAFAFSYGEKENGAIFSHMCVMFANALYRRGFVREGYEVLMSLFRLATNTKVSKIYPCLPEYFNIEGRGMYSYLTGSASWYVMTMLTQVFGVKGHYGDLLISPKFTREQFEHTDTLSVSCFFAERRISFNFQNRKKLNFNEYMVSRVKVNPQPLPSTKVSRSEILIKREHLLQLPENSHVIIEIILDI